MTWVILPWALASLPATPEIAGGTFGSSISFLPPLLTNSATWFSWSTRSVMIAAVSLISLIAPVHAAQRLIDLLERALVAGRERRLATFRERLHELDELLLGGLAKRVGLALPGAGDVRGPSRGHRVDRVPGVVDEFEEVHLLGRRDELRRRRRAALPALLRGVELGLGLRRQRREVLRDLVAALLRGGELVVRGRLNPEQDLPDVDLVGAAALERPRPALEVRLTALDRDLRQVVDLVADLRREPVVVGPHPLRLGPGVAERQLVEEQLRRGNGAWAGDRALDRGDDAVVALRNRR